MVLSAAGHLEVPNVARIKEVLASMKRPLGALARAGVLVGVTLQLRDAAGTIEVAIVFDAFDIGEVAAVDLSRLKLVASPQGQGRLEIVCAEGPLGRELVEQTLLPCLSDEALAYCQVRYVTGEPAGEALAGEIVEEEESADEYDDDAEDWR
jgi:hypothetical protein